MKPERGMASSKIEYRRTKTNFERKKIKNKKVVIQQYFIQDETFIFCFYVELSSLLGIKTKKKSRIKPKILVQPWTELKIMIWPETKTKQIIK